MGYLLYKNTQINCDTEKLKIPVFLELFHFSFVQFNNRAMPEDIMTYKTAIQLQKLYNATISSLEWISLNVNQILTTRQTAFIITKTSNTKVGLNILTNSFSILNGRIPLNWLNNTLDTFKI